MNAKEFSASFAAAAFAHAAAQPGNNPYWDNACRSEAYFPIAFELAVGRKPSAREVAAYKLDLLERDHEYNVARGKDCHGFIVDPREPHILVKQRRLVGRLAAS
jgi:hypothetical protein